MALEDGSPLEGQYNQNASGTSWPAALDSRGLKMSQPASEESSERASSKLVQELQEIQEIRSHYSLDVRDSTLFLGYDLRGVARRYTLPFAKMPLPGSLVWLLYGGPGRRKVAGTFVTDSIRAAEDLVGRPLSQIEAEGFALHASRRTLYSTASTISAIGIGCGLSVFNRHLMKFPFRKPQPLERYNNFPNKWLPVLTGNYARIMWHITRVNLYIGLCFLLLSPLYSSMGDSAMMVGLYRDQRTQEVAKSMAEALKKSQGMIRRMRSNKAQAAGGPPPTANDAPEEDSFHQSSEGGAANDYGNARDFSGDTAYTDGTTDTGLLGDSQMRTREREQRSPSSFTGNPAFRRKPVRQPERDVDSTSDSDYIFDDASPTAGNDPDMATRGSSERGGSAWERVRRGADDGGTQTGVNPPGTRQAKQGPKARELQQKGARDEYESRGDSFSFSRTDEDKQLAKEQAQRDFDQMLEDERKGSAGGEGGGGGGTWERRRNG